MKPCVFGTVTTSERGCAPSMCTSADFLVNGDPPTKSARVLRVVLRYPSREALDVAWTERTAPLLEASEVRCVLASTSLWQHPELHVVFSDDVTRESIANATQLVRLLALFEDDVSVREGAGDDPQVELRVMPPGHG